ncbi:hypothetical protein WJX73_006122 [Symbiochloris irregularis]|uniref:Uncharacterized protein n=1 Tax=Symbiochloris irregularis TaxID=706552 RepID=A0AAW1NEW0_9CHLO
MGASGDEGPQEVLRPYVAFFAALRLAFGAFVADTTVRCKSLLRHHLEANTSQYAALSWAPTTSILGTMHARHPLRESQLTVPETPSPVAMTAMRKKPGAATRTAVRPPLSKAFEAQAQVGDPHARICATAEGMFARIREAVGANAVPAVKAALLQPMCCDLAARLSVALCAGSDADFMEMFTAPSAVEGMRTQHDELTKRLEGLQTCRTTFQELARSL